MGSIRPDADLGRVPKGCSFVFLCGKAANQAIAFGGELLVGHTAIGIARIFRLQPVEEKHFEPAVMFGLDGAARLQFE